MTAEQALIELLSRLSAQTTDRIYLTEQELNSWPDNAVTALKAQRLLNKAKPASSVICPGCEQQCLRPVQALTDTHGLRAFVLCDVRDDINRVSITRDQIDQWTCSIDAITRFISQVLQLRPTQAHGAPAELIALGMIKGQKNWQMLSLTKPPVLQLVIGEQRVSLLDLITFDQGKYSLDVDYLKTLADRKTQADPRYTPSKARREANKLDTQDKYDSWRKEYRRLKREYPDYTDTWYAKKIAKSPLGMGKSAETIRKRMVQSL